MIKNNLFAMIFLFSFFLSGVTHAADLVVEKKAKLPGPELKYKSQSKVPTFDLVIKKPGKGKPELSRVKNIPRLNIGEEPTLKAGALSKINLPEPKPFKEFNVIQKPSPNEIDLSAWISTDSAKKLISTAPVGKSLITVDPKSQPLNPPSFSAVRVGALLQNKESVEKIDELSPSQMKLLQAMIFLENKKDYAMALALFAELIDEPVVATEARYNLGITSNKLGLYSEYKHRLLEIINDPSIPAESPWKKKSAQSLAENAEPGDKTLVGILDPIIESLKIELSSIDQYNLNRAKYYLDKSNLTKAFAGVDEILLDSPLYLEAMFLKSLILYKGNQIQDSLLAQQTVLQNLEEKKDPKYSSFKAIVALTLARLQFQAGQYKEAFSTYLKVDKSNPEWLQAMTEQAWSQILSEDYEGAAGNMFSLHTDFFKKAFNPESYVVRTVGYLNLCQYGDGAKVVYDFKKKYSPVLKQMQSFKESHTNTIDYYDTIKTWAKNPDLLTVEGLPREFIFALTQHPSFIEEQKSINSLEDQVGRMNKITINLIRTEKKALAAQNDARKQLAAIKKDFEETRSQEKKAQLKEKFKYQEKRLISAKIEHYIAKKARNSIKALRQEGLVRLDVEKEALLKAAGGAIAQRYNQMLSKLSESLDQSEVLQYELYSGAGEHLRYQMAGGDVNSKERAELKVEDGKSLNWEFKGELWADELGHYRSSLKNVCPPEEKISSNTKF
jgi:hypothetical protein